MSKLLEKRNTIYGVCAIWIVLFHTFRRIGMPYIPVLTNIVGIGNMAVDVFFFFSGLCLALSVKKHDYQIAGWGGYYKRRLSRILLPYLIICIPYYLWAAAFETSGSIVHKAVVFIANLSSASFWLRGTQTTWYAYGILVFYLLFPLLYRAVNKSRTASLSLLAGLIAFAVVSAYVPILKNSMRVWARLPIFTIGIIVPGEGDRIKHITDKKWMLASGVVFIAIGLATSISEISESFTIPQVYRLLLYIPMTLSLLNIVSKVGGKVQFFEWIGTLSLEIYLVHITLLHPLKYYGIMDTVGYWLYLILPVIAVLISWLVKEIEKRIKIGA